MHARSFSGGVADTLSGGLTSTLRTWSGINSVDQSLGAYRAGTAVGTVAAAALGGAGGVGSLGGIGSALTRGVNLVQFAGTVVSGIEASRNNDAHGVAGSLAGVGLTAFGLRKGFRQSGPLGSAVGGQLGLLVAASPESVCIDGPAEQFVKEAFGLAEGLVNTHADGHLEGSPGHPAVDSQQTVRSKSAQAAMATGGEGAAKVDVSQGGHQLAGVSSLEVVALGAGAASSSCRFFSRRANLA
jgi:hypothetical protein